MTCNIVRNDIDGCDSLAESIVPPYTANEAP